MTATVLKFDSNDLNKAPVQVESMLNERYRHACTIFNSALHDGRPLAIVAGGSGASKKAEIWDFTKEGTTWHQGIIIFTFIISFSKIYHPNNTGVSKVMIILPLECLSLQNIIIVAFGCCGSVG